MEARRLDEVEKHMLYVTYNTVPLTMFSLVPQYLLLGGLDGIVEESIDLFFSDPAPNSCNQRFAYGFYGFGTIGSILSVYLARHISAWGDDTSWFEDHLNDSRFDKYCWVMTGQSAGNFIFCLILYYLTDLRLAASTESHPQATTSVDVNNEIELVELDSAIELQFPNEYLVNVSGIVNNVAGASPTPVIQSLTFETNLRTYGPYGHKQGGTAFSLPIKKGLIVGFSGRTGELLDAIGLNLSL
ncbi:hypothetical protein L484_010147 [Morus notabilis]|uniref:Jacalin-type lectin domain-containing protein n=1 Tax=Morus notabilis TaxID=981085 RepID=W9R9H0_9ROSA|nr:hypothetical protein L484_010147 [Morus notabilis]